MLQLDKLKIGDLVRWQVCYDDDPDIIRDAGLGILLHIKEIEDRHNSDKTRKKKLFSVYRNIHKDTMTLTETYICSLN